MKKILIVEDSQMDAVIEEELLVREGFDVTVARTGREGIEKAGEIRPDLAIVDLILPDIGGYEVCSAIKKEPGLKDTVVVVLSIKDKIDDITRAFQSGADDYIIKPIIPEFLTRKIKLYLGVR